MSERFCRVKKSLLTAIAIGAFAVSGFSAVRVPGEAAHYCPNDAGCPPQIKGRIEHFIARKAMNIESLGPETVDDYYRQGLIHNIADLYRIQVQDINGDGSVNNKDVLRLQKYLKDSSTTADAAALDVNGDGKVNNKDLIRLTRWLKYHDVEIY